MARRGAMLRSTDGPRQGPYGQIKYSVPLVLGRIRVVKHMTVGGGIALRCVCGIIVKQTNEDLLGGNRAWGGLACVPAKQLPVGAMW